MRNILIAAALSFPLAVSIPLTVQADELIVRGDRLFIHAEVNGRKAEALLDSGAEMTVLDTRFAREAQLAEGEEVTARGTGAGTVKAQIVEGVDLTALGRQIVLPAAAVMDLSDIEARVVKAPVPVIVGRDLFDAGRLAIDIEGRRIEWQSGDEPMAGVMLPLSSSHGIETIPVTFGGVAADADFDLGNGTGLLLSREMAERLNLRPVGVEPAGGIGGAAGRTVVYVPELTIAGRIFRNVRAHVADNAQVPANVGVGLLRRFRIVTDFRQRAIWLHPIE